MTKQTQEQQQAYWRQQYRKHIEKQRALARARSTRRRAKEKAEKEISAPKAYTYKGEAVQFSPQKPLNTYEKWNLWNQKKYGDRGAEHRNTVARIHREHPTWSLSTINAYERKGKAGRKREYAEAPQGYCYEVKCGIEYHSRDPHQSRRGYLTATVYTTGERDQQQLLNLIFQGPQTNTWLDGVRPNRITSWDTGAPARSTTVTHDHVRNVHVRSIHGW